MTSGEGDDALREPLFERVASLPWGLLPAAFGLALFAAAVAAALLPHALPDSPSLALAIAAATGLALVVTGALAHRAIGARRYFVATQEGLIEEVSQEFDKVRETIGAEGARATRESVKLARLSSRVERLEADLADAHERVAALESRLGRSVTIRPTAPPVRAVASADARAPIKAEVDAGP